jgi:hypothetical protein
MSGAHISEVAIGAGGAKGGGKCLCFRTVFRAKAASSAKKRIVPAIGVLAALSSEGTEEYSPRDQVPEVQSKAKPHGPSAEPQAQSGMISRPRHAPEASLQMVPSVGAAGALTGCFLI